MPDGPPDTWLVQPHDAVGRYFVASQSQEGKYLVDVLAYGGHGQCSCADWVYRIKPARDQGQEPPKRYCKHLAHAREYFTDEVIRRMLATALHEAGAHHSGEGA